MGKAMRSEKKSKIRRGEPIEALGLTFYPIKMSQYEEFLDCRDAWCTRLSTLPMPYYSMSFLSALWALDVDSFERNGKPIGLFQRVIRLLCLSLRLEYSAELLREIVYIGESGRELHHLKLQQGGNAVEVTPREFANHIRPLVAQQNGLKLPDESDNPDIVQAEEMMARDALKKSKLDYDTDTLIASVAYLSGVQERALEEWTVLQFEKRAEAIERDKRFMLYGQAELSGMVKFPKGNPFPSWRYDSKQQSAALIDINEVEQKHRGIGSVKQAIASAASASPSQTPNFEKGE